MINRILIVVMLILTLFTQYAGVPSLGFTATAQSLNTVPSSPVPQTEESANTQEIPTPSPEVLPGSPTPTPEVSPGAPTPIPENTPLPDTYPGTSTPPAITIGPPAIEDPLVHQLPAFDVLSKEYLLFEKDMVAIIDKAKKQSGIKSTFGLFIMDLKTELSYGAHKNLVLMDPVDKVPEGFFNSASVIKMFQGYIFCDMLRYGELDAEKVYYDKVTGRKFKILPMIKSMIKYSDNNYSNACLRLVDNKQSNAVLSRLGITNSRLYGEMSGAVGYSRQNNIERYGTDKRCARITPQDSALILYNIYRNKDTDPYMKVLNEALIGNVYNTRIPVGVKRVSKKYLIAHKTGTNSALGVYNDAGIVYCKNPFILVSYTQSTTSFAGHTFIRSLAEQLTRYFDSKVQ